VSFAELVCGAVCHAVARWPLNGVKKWPSARMASPVMLVLHAEHRNTASFGHRKHELGVSLAASGQGAGIGVSCLVVSFPEGTDPLGCR
jgi:hypothetical protein